MAEGHYLKNEHPGTIYYTNFFNVEYEGSNRIFENKLSLNKKCQKTVLKIGMSGWHSSRLALTGTDISGHYF